MTLSNILKTIKQIFGRAEELKRELINQYSEEYLIYLTEKKKKVEELFKKASFWEEKRKVRTRFSKRASFPFLKRYGSQGKIKGAEVGPGAPIKSKEAQPYSVTTRTFSPTVVPSGKKARDEAAPTTSPAAKEAAETGTSERPGGNLLNPRHSHQQSLGNKGSLCTGTTNVVSMQLQIKNIPRHDDVTLLPQEWFQLLIALGKNIEINKNFSLAFYMSLSKNFSKMAADLDQCGQKEAAFVLYHKFLITLCGKAPHGKKIYKEIMEIFKRSNILKNIKQIFGRTEELKRELINQYSEEYLIYLTGKKKKEDEEVANKASLWKEKTQIRTRFTKWASFHFLKRNGSQEIRQGGEVGSGTTMSSKEAQPHSLTKRTFSPTVVPSGKESQDEKAPTK
ncbi:AMSH-like protease [Apodemus speciosus]|uniref:AMSH-like protease n=1 Tax=Apodemus speciosus TaxID=105296 RepID=A0ABQ0FW05_APOSI